MDKIKKTTENLKMVVLDEWRKIKKKKDLIEDLVKSMPERLRRIMQEDWFNYLFCIICYWYYVILL